MFSHGFRAINASRRAARTGPMQGVGARSRLVALCFAFSASASSAKRALEIVSSRHLDLLWCPTIWMPLPISQRPE